MKQWIWVLLLASLPSVAWAQKSNSKTVTWPLPWAVDTAVEYDQHYEQTDGRGPQSVRFSVRSVARLNTVEADQDGFVQSWVSAGSELETGQLPASMQDMAGAMAKAFEGLSLDVRLDAEGAFVGLENAKELGERYRQSLRSQLDTIESKSRGKGKDDQQARQMRQAVFETLTSTDVVTAQFSELPLVYNYISGGGFQVGINYQYEDEASSPLGAGSIKRSNTLRISRTDLPGVYEIHWKVVPDLGQTAAVIRNVVDGLLAGTGESVDNGEFEGMLKDADFSATAIYRVDARTGIVQSMDYVRNKRFGKKDQVSRTRLILRR